MNRTLLSLSALAALGSLPTASHADLSFNIGGVSDYRYRGISQTRLDPALQAGMDFGEGGFYLAIGVFHPFDLRRPGAEVEAALAEVHPGLQGRIEPRL